MKPCPSNLRNRALTLLEVLVVIMLLAVLFVILLPALVPVHSTRQKISCVSNLGQIAVAYRIWGGDHDDKYPMFVSVTNGGAMELVATGDLVVCFQVMSNELSTPRLLICPEDTHRHWATNFSTLKNSNISFLVNLNAADAYPQMILSGDDNFAINDVPVKSGLLDLSRNTSIAWSSGRHVALNSHFWTPPRNKFFGYIGFADSHVEQITSDGLNIALVGSVATNRLAIP